MFALLRPSLAPCVACLSLLVSAMPATAERLPPQALPAPALGEAGDPDAPLPPVIGSVKPWYGFLAGGANPLPFELPVAETIVQDRDASFVQLEFDDARLPRDATLRITSLFDGDVQTLGTSDFHGGTAHSAYFNGAAVLVRLVVPPFSAPSRVRIKTIAVGAPGEGLDTICGRADNRVASNRKSCCRLLLRSGSTVSVCSGWLVSTNNGIATAGHCISGIGTITAQFNVPSSLSNGTIVNPPASNQYTWQSSTKIYANAGLGNDFGVFRVFGNPYSAQQARFTTTSANPTLTICTVEGFGSDNGSANFTEQRHSGVVISKSGSVVRYVIDTTGGNSGSPVYDSAGRAVAVHTNGGCTSSGGSNVGTAVTHWLFAAAINAVQ